MSLISDQEQPERFTEQLASGPPSGLTINAGSVCFYQYGPAKKIPKLFFET